MKPRERGIPRREFVKSAVAIGGLSALSACSEREQELQRRSTTPRTSTDEDRFPPGPGDLSSLPQRQHAWNEYLVRDKHGNTLLPQHQVLLFLRYEGSVPPTSQERARVENAFRTIESAYQRGTGGDTRSFLHRGLLFTVGYGSSYFERFDSSLADTVDLQSPTEVLSELDERPEKADPYDALLLLTSDFGSIVLSVEEALFGNLDRINRVEVDEDVSGIFSKQERRTGFVGIGLPHERIEHADIPEKSPLSMGFKSGFSDNQPPEDKVTIRDGPFASGTTQLVSRLEIDLESWYELDEDDRVHDMFSPHHTTQQVGDAGRGLADHSGITRSVVEQLDEDARDGQVGHSQKAARARDDDFDPVILRRSEGIATEDPTPAFNFSSVQRGISDFVRTRRAMNAADLGHVDDAHHGILDYFEVSGRSTFLVPPRGHRALPTPRPD